MLSIKKAASAQHTEHYFAHDESNYFFGGSEDSHSRWLGEGAKALGLEGAVEQSAMKALLVGQVEDQTVGRVRDGTLEHTPGWDFTLSAPKSVSLLGIAGGDERVVKAHERAVTRALQYVEQSAQTRVQKGGVVENVTTGNLMIASFKHTLSRAMEPQLHSHNFVFNLTHKDGEWRSLDSRPLFDLKMTAGLLYRNELAVELKKAGYDIDVVDRAKGFFEVRGVDNQTIQSLSTRRAEIVAAAEHYGYETAKGFADAAVRTRGAKQTMSSAIESDWASKLAKNDKSLLALIDESKARAVSTAHQRHENTSDVINSLGFAIAHLSEREHVFSESDLLKAASEHGFGDITQSGLRQGLSERIQQGELVSRTLNTGKGQKTVYMTVGAIEKEVTIARLLKAGQRQFEPASTGPDLANNAEGIQLNQDQMAALKGVLTSKDQFIGIQGYAGVGKTTVLSEIVEGFEQAGYGITLIGTTGSATSVLGAELGREASTLAAHLYQQKQPETFDLDLFVVNLFKSNKSPASQLWIVDEASFSQTDDVVDLMTQAREKQARVLWVGDQKQLGAVNAGKPFTLLQNAGMDTATIKQIIRQRDAHALAAVKAAIDQNPVKALDAIAKQIVENKDEGALVNRLVDDLFTLSRSDREKALVLIPDHKTRDQVNALIRERLKEQGEITGKEIDGKVFRSNGLTVAQKSHSGYYTRGATLILNQKIPSVDMEIGRAYQIEGIDPQDKTVKVSDGKKTTAIPVNSKNAQKYAVGTLIDAPVAAGDRIVWKAKDKQSRLFNGAKGTVLGHNRRGVSTVEFDLPSGKRTVNVDLAKRNTWDYNHTATVYTAQGRTVDQTFALVSSERKKLLSARSFYVSLSRSRGKTRLYVDDKQKVAERVLANSGAKTSALETLIQSEGAETAALDKLSAERLERIAQQNLKEAASDQSLELTR